MLELSGRMILIAVVLGAFLFVILRVTNVSLGFTGDAICSTSISVRSTITNLFGGVGRALMPDKYFDMVPFLCHTRGYASQDSHEVEEKLAEEIERCYRLMGEWKSNGVFPSHSFLCSFIIYDAPLEEDNYVNLSVVYDYLLNSSVVPASTFDFDNEELDWKNYLRFCMASIYESGIVCNHNLYYEDLDHQSSSDFCDLNYMNYSNPNGCLSLKETVLNGWQFDLEQPINIGTGIISGDVSELCYDVLYRYCGAEEEDYDSYRDCLDDLRGLCFGIKLSNVRDEESFDGFEQNFCDGDDERCKDFLARLQYEMQNFSKIGTNKTTILRRGTFYIRFYDYTDWLQKAFDSDWNSFPECNNDIIARNEFINAISLANSDLELKHDYIAIGYVPYIDYKYLYRDQFKIDTNIVQIGGAR